MVRISLWLSLSLSCRPLSIKLFLSLSALSLLITAAKSRRNVKVDDNDGLIMYSPPGGWSEIVYPLDAGGSHMVTVDSQSVATFTFTGAHLPVEFTAFEALRWTACFCFVFLRPNMLLLSYICPYPGRNSLLIFYHPSLSLKRHLNRILVSPLANITLDIRIHRQRTRVSCRPPRSQLLY
ncbi:hypothetical protein BJ165DRAFT_635509 [Panaeolus papilionaceus]|nr:hypothetical protein BJ165DRAFT_635509 [Panaeolus papilionaceus]